jgi:hypothetical protein
MPVKSVFVKIVFDNPMHFVCFIFVPSLICRVLKIFIPSFVPFLKNSPVNRIEVYRIESDPRASACGRSRAAEKSPDGAI